MAKSKILTLAEVAVVSALFNQIANMGYQNQGVVDYLELDYSTADAGVSIVTQRPGADAPPNSRMFTLIEAALVSWLIPTIASLPHAHQVAVDSLQLKYDKQAGSIEIKMSGEANEPE